MSKLTSLHTPAPKPAPREPSRMQRALQALSFGFLSAGLQRERKPTPRPASSAPTKSTAPCPARDPRKGQQAAPVAAAHPVPTAAAAAPTADALAAARAAGHAAGLAEGRKAECARWHRVMTSPATRTRDPAVAAEITAGTETAERALSIVGRLAHVWDPHSKPDRQARNPNVGIGDWHRGPPPAGATGPGSPSSASGMDAALREAAGRR
jgi:hypothetical protein